MRPKLRLREVFQPEATTLRDHFKKRHLGHPRDALDCLGQAYWVDLVRSASMFVLETTEPVAFATIHVGRRKKNVWEPYANWTLCYTTPAERRKGYAHALARYTLGHVAFLGCRRMKSKIGSYLGLRLHWSLRHDIWGFLLTGELQVDTPLRGEFPSDRAPMGARAVIKSPSRPLSAIELASLIRDNHWNPNEDYAFLDACAQSSATADPVAGQPLTA
jgi:hypothetical protein